MCITTGIIVQMGLHLILLSTNRCDAIKSREKQGEKDEEEKRPVRVDSVFS
jgi:hypothetical protein